MAPVCGLEFFLLLSTSEADLILCYYLEESFRVCKLGMEAMTSRDCLGKRGGDEANCGV